MHQLTGLCACFGAHVPAASFRAQGGNKMAHIHIYTGADGSVPHPTVRTITAADLWDSLARGYDDFKAMPTHLLFLGLIYPIAGIVLAGFSFGYNLFPMLFPLAAGFALIGPVTAIGLYEISRQREEGNEPDTKHVLDVVRSPSFPAIATISAVLAVLFVTWLIVAQSLYQSLFGYLPPASMSKFVHDVMTTPNGHTLIITGNLIGLAFAIVAMVIGVVSFPLLLDRDVGVLAALATSVRAVAHNAATMTLWGLIVAALLLIGSIPLFVGLAIVVPVLGHATWHLYRKLVAR
jgi:uncharacterized membrane protein